MAKNKPLKFRLRVDIQCGSCGSLTHQTGPAGPVPTGAGPSGAAPAVAGSGFPRFCPCCGAALERFCLACHKKADMFFDEWWPEDDECVRTYSPARRCGGCNAILDQGEDGSRQSDYQH